MSPHTRYLCKRWFGAYTVLVCVAGTIGGLAGWLTRENDAA